jgi:CheY-like chemotaxis protein
MDGCSLFLWVTLPSVGRVTVLVVDDNLDMVRFYRRATEGTAYHIVHIGEGRALFDAIEAYAPEIVLLDVMLPDVDGWDLLMRLHENPATRSLPVIVCSVVREEELALSLGATRYLSKPVRHRTLIEALDQSLRPRREAPSKAPANSGAAC